MKIPNTATEFETKLRMMVTSEARVYVQAGGKIGKLAKKAGVAHSTCSKMIYGETRWPRLNTAVGVAVALGLKLEVNK